MTTAYSPHHALVAGQLQNPKIEKTIDTENYDHICNGRGLLPKFSPEKYSNRPCISSDTNGFKNITYKNTLCETALYLEKIGKAMESSSNDYNAAILKQNPQGNNCVSVDNDVVYVNKNCSTDNNIKKTKDCRKTQTNQEDDNSIDVTDNVMQRFSSNSHNLLNSNNNRQYSQDNSRAANEGCISEVSSIISSPTVSTASSPLSTPIRLAPMQQFQHSRQHCCQKLSNFSSTQNRQHYFHHHNSHNYYKKSERFGGDTNNSTCKTKKNDSRFNPSPYRQLLPIALCILSFAAVFATLIVYMDTTEIRHQQFRLNMSRDYELNGVAQDDPALIAFLRQIHMRKYPLHFPIKNEVAVTTSSSLSLNNLTSIGSTIEPRFNFSGLLKTADVAPTMANYVSNLTGGKRNGAVIQSLTGPMADFIAAPWLSEKLNWMGVLIEPEPRWYFSLRKQNAQRSRMQVVHACVSPNSYPKEITMQNDEVRINSLHDEETSWFNSRVKCFPLYTIMLACDRVQYDLLSLGVQGQELEVLQTLPFDKVNIEFISIHLLDDKEDLRGYVQSITKFLGGKSYKLLRQFGQNFFYQHTVISRLRKKDTTSLNMP